MTAWGLFEATLAVQRESHERGTKDDFGNVQDRYGPPEDVMVYAFDQGGSAMTAWSQVVQDATLEHRVISKPTLYAPADVALADRDRITVPGLGNFVVDGEPARWSHPLPGMPSGAVVKLRRADG